MICPNCGKENKNTNIRCEFCSTQLIDTNESNQQFFNLNTNNVEVKDVEDLTKKISRLKNILISIFAIFWLLFGMLFTSIGLFSNISEHNKTKGYKKTTAILRDYVNCTYDDSGEFCEAIYEYQVNGITYSVSPDSLKNRDDFAETDTVYYNPDNPSESLMYANWGALTIMGIIIISVAIGILILKNIKMKKNKNNTKM